MLMHLFTGTKTSSWVLVKQHELQLSTPCMVFSVNYHILRRMLGYTDD